MALYFLREAFGCLRYFSSLEKLRQYQEEQMNAELTEVFIVKLADLDEKNSLVIRSVDHDESDVEGLLKMSINMLDLVLEKLPCPRSVPS